MLPQTGMSTPPRYGGPASSDRPHGAHRFDVYSPKLQRQVTLFGRYALDLWTTLEASPQVISFCERPIKFPERGRNRCFDFWVSRPEADELLLLLRDNERPDGPGTPKQKMVAELEGTMLEGARIRCLDPVHVAGQKVALANWGAIIRDLSAFERFVPQSLCNELAVAMTQPQTIRQLQEGFVNHDNTMVRVAVYMLLHQGRASCKQLETHALGPDHLISAP